MGRLRIRSLFLAVLIFDISLKSLPSKSAKTRHYPRVPEKLRGGVSLFIFGDSFLDAGNNNYINTSTLDQANFPPYGQTFFGFPTGRFSDGRIVSDFIAEFANLPLIPPFLQPGFRHYYHGVNFASSGAGVLVETFQGSVIDLQTQVRNFKKVKALMRRELGRVEGEERLSKGVYLFSVGTNDYMSLYLTNSTLLTTYSESQYVAFVIANFTAVVKEVYSIGGRKFGFLNLPSFGCFPGFRMKTKNGSCSKQGSNFIELHNKALSKLLIKLETKLEGFKYSLYDFNTMLSNRINLPSTYGFKEGNSACCGIGKYRGEFSCGGKRIVKEFKVCENPSEYVFWDSYHPTQTLHKQLALQMWTASPNPFAYNLFQLFQFY